MNLSSWQNGEVLVTIWVLVSSWKVVWEAVQTVWFLIPPSPPPSMKCLGIPISWGFTVSVLWQTWGTQVCLWNTFISPGPATHLCASLCVSTRCASAHGSRKRVVRPRGLEWQAAVSNPTWLLGNKHRLFVRAASALKPRTVPPSPALDVRSRVGEILGCHLLEPTILASKTLFTV